MGIPSGCGWGTFRPAGRFPLADPGKANRLSETETLSPVLPDAIEQAVRCRLAKAGQRALRPPTAESCPGGLLASLLTDVQGVAHAFDRGFVTYSDEPK